MPKPKEDLTKSPRRIPKRSTSRFGQEQFLCQGWECEHDDDETITLNASGWRCKYLNQDSIVISPHLYQKKSDSQHKANRNFSSNHMVDFYLQEITSKQPQDRCNISTTLPVASTAKCATAIKSQANATRNGRVKRLIYITANNSLCIYKGGRIFDASEGMIDTSTEQCEKNFTKANGSPLYAQQGIKENRCDNTVIKEMDATVDMTENYYIAKLKELNTAGSSMNSTIGVIKSPFHGHIQKCILKLYNGNPTSLTNFVRRDRTNPFILNISDQGKRFEGQISTLIPENHQAYLSKNSLTSVRGTFKTENKNLFWSQNSQKTSKVGLSKEKSRLVYSLPVLPGKDIYLKAQEVWGFPAFHPHPLKTASHNSPQSSRIHTRSGTRIPSASRHVHSSQSHTSDGCETKNDLIPLGSQVTLGLMLGAMQKRFKRNYLNVMFGQANR